MIREACGTNEGCSGRYLADLSPGGTHTACESIRAGQMVAHHTAYINAGVRPGRHQAAGPRPLMGASDASLKFQRL